MLTEPPKLHRDYGSVNHETVPTGLTTLESPSTSSGITCKVCNGFIDLMGRQHQLVVKCETCREATPIGRPPKGKRYIRCECGCLLIFRDGALGICCPRSHCKKTINLVSTSIHGKTLIFTCLYCYSPFVFEILEESVNDTYLVQCPHFHCKQISAVGGRDLARKWAMFFLMLSSALFAVGTVFVCSTTQTEESFNGALYIIYIGFFVIGFVSFLRGYHYWTIRVSKVEGTI